MECAHKAVGFQKGHTSWLKGKKGLQLWHNISGLKPHKKGEYKHSEKTLKKLSIAHIGHIPWNKGKGNRTSKNERARDSKEFDLWRGAVFARDDWICQKCGQKGEQLHPHHIFNFATYLDLRFAINNGITLCQECHREFHKQYGQRNNTEEQINEFLCQK